MNYEEMNIFLIIFPIFESRRPPHRLEEVRLAPQWPAASRRRPIFLNIGHINIIFLTLLMFKLMVIVDLEQ